jgi:hypothetical protein
MFFTINPLYIVNIPAFSFDELVPDQIPYLDYSKNLTHAYLVNVDDHSKWRHWLIFHNK